MILEQAEHETEVEGVKTTEFIIKASGKAFKVLTSNLYTNKPAAILREISQNSWDAHIMAGKIDVPFHVKLPNYLEPTLEIRDFGTSMTENFMLTKYVQAFHSTKEKNNNTNGAFGIGRLSPFSVSDSYTVICYRNGIEYQYSVFYNNEDIPTIAQLDKKATTEPDGVLVRFDVPQHLINDFVNKAKEIYTFFKVQPVISGVNDFKVNDLDYSIVSESGDWGITNGISKSRAVMGCYGYEISENALPNLSMAQRQLLQAGFICHFDIGEIHCNASREGLSYDETTINAIKSKLEKASKELIEVTQKSIEKAESRWEAHAIYGQMLAGSLSNILRDGNYTWNGEKIESNNLHINRVTVPYHPTINKYSLEYRRRRGRGERYYVHNTQVNTLYPYKKTVFILSDIAASEEETSYRMKTLLNDGSSYDNYYLLKFHNTGDFDLFNNYYFNGKLEFKKLSEVPIHQDLAAKKAIKKQYVQNHDKRHQQKTLVYNNNVSGYDIQNWDGEYASLNYGEGIYVWVERFQFHNKLGTKIESAKLNQIANFLKLHFGINKIYGFKISEKGKLGKNWINLYDYIQNKLNEYLTDENKKKIANYLAANTVALNYLQEIESQVLTPDGCFKKFVEFVKSSTAQDVASEISKYYDAGQLINMNIYHGIVLPAPDYTKDYLEEKYPLINIYKTEASVEYINLMDNRNKTLYKVT